MMRIETQCANSFGEYSFLKSKLIRSGTIITKNINILTTFKGGAKDTRGTFKRINRL